jgi:hypothetical protein
MVLKIQKSMNSCGKATGPDPDLCASRESRDLRPALISNVPSRGPSRVRVSSAKDASFTAVRCFRMSSIHMPVLLYQFCCKLYDL